MNKNWDQISALFHYENGGRHKDFEFTYSFFTFFSLGSSAGVWLPTQFPHIGSTTVKGSIFHLHPYPFCPQEILVQD